MAGFRSSLYRALRVANDVTAVSRAIETASPAPVVNRWGRKSVLRAAGRVNARLFPSTRGRR